jgi:hypothetical protein
VSGLVNLFYKSPFCPLIISPIFPNLYLSFYFIFLMFFIFRCALVGSMGYLVFYQSVLDPRGIHLYIILSPRYTDVKHVAPLTKARNVPVLCHSASSTDLKHVTPCASLCDPLRSVFLFVPRCVCVCVCVCCERKCNHSPLVCSYCVCKRESICLCVFVVNALCLSFCLSLFLFLFLSLSLSLAMLYLSLTHTRTTPNIQSCTFNIVCIFH